MNIKTFRPQKFGIILSATVAVAMAATTLRSEAKVAYLESPCAYTDWPVSSVECVDTNYYRQQHLLTDITLINLVSEPVNQTAEASSLNQQASVKADRLPTANEEEVYYQIIEVRGDQSSSLHRIFLEIMY